jgi:hypothetical protein
MRSIYGSGKPRAAHDEVVDAILTILAVLKAVEDIFIDSSAMSHRQLRASRFQIATANFILLPENDRFRHGLLDTSLAQRPFQARLWLPGMDSNHD